MSAVRTANQGWHNLLGSAAPSPGTTAPMVRLAGDAGQCLLRAGLLGGTGPMALYVQATVRSGRVSITASCAGVVTPIVHLEPITGSLNGGPRTLSIELPSGATLLVLDAGSPGTVIDVAALAVGPAGAVGPFGDSAEQSAGRGAADGDAGTRAPRAATATQAEPAAQPRDTTITGTNGGTGNGGTPAISASPSLRRPSAVPSRGSAVCCTEHISAGRS